MKLYLSKVRQQTLALFASETWINYASAAVYASSARNDETIVGRLRQIIRLVSDSVFIF